MVMLRTPPVLCCRVHSAAVLSSACWYDAWPMGSQGPFSHHLRVSPGAPQLDPSFQTHFPPHFKPSRFQSNLFPAKTKRFCALRRTRAQSKWLRPLGLNLRSDSLPGLLCRSRTERGITPPIICMSNSIRTNSSLRATTCSALTWIPMRYGPCPFAGTHTPNPVPVPSLGLLMWGWRGPCPHRVQPHPCLGLRVGLQHPSGLGLSLRIPAQQQ